VLRAESKREDLKTFYIPATEAATRLGNMAVANLVLLGAYLEATKVLPLETVEATLEERMAGGRRQDMLSLNKAALREGARLMAEHPRRGEKQAAVGNR
jgi:2-oxoglutarate ferredoxin oxidoreductase subunit gamma